MEQLVSSGRLPMLNHTYHWKVTPNEEYYDKDDEGIRDTRKLYKNNNYHAKKTRNRKDRKRSSGIKLALEVKGSACCANPCARQESWRKNWISHGNVHP